MNTVAPELIHLFLKEAIYVVSADRPVQELAPSNVQSIEQAPTLPVATQPSLQPLKSIPKVPTPTQPSGTALPVIPPRGLVILVHQPDGNLEPALTEMLGKLAGATEPNTALHVQLIGDLETYSWPVAWHPWPARLTLLLGWPPALLARCRVAAEFQVLKFGATQVLAGPHPAALAADRGLKAQLWAAIQTSV